ncbi:hypothetical protein ES703_44416 [subsurface metagenome]
MVVEAITFKDLTLPYSIKLTIPSNILTNPCAPASTTPAFFNISSLSGVLARESFALDNDFLKSSTKSGVW